MQNRNAGTWFFSRVVELTTETRNEDGNVFYMLHEKVDDPAEFVIYECWRNQEALDFHMDQEYLKKFLEDSSAWLREPIKGTICREIQI